MTDPVMPNYVRYREDIETIASDEAETQAKIIETMTSGLNNTREKYGGRAVRISHAKAHGLLKGELRVEANLLPELAQGIFARPATYPVLVRVSHAPGEFVDDSKVSTPRGMAVKVFNVEGPHLPPFEDITTQDFVFNTGSKEFIVGGSKAFLQAFKPNAEIAPKLSDTTKGVVSNLARGANAVLHVVGYNSANLDFYGHEKLHPLAEPYFSQTPFRYGDYVAKLGFLPATDLMKSLENSTFDPKSYDALREATVAFFKSNPAEFDVVVQLNSDLEKMPLEDPTVKWSEEESPYRAVARIVLPVQEAYTPATEQAMDEDLSFSPAHTLVAHRPLGGINRARLAAYTALSTLRRQVNHGSKEEPATLEQVRA